MFVLIAQIKDTIERIGKMDFVQWLDNGKFYRGVIDKTQGESDNFFQVIATSRYIQKDDYFKLYESEWIWTIHKEELEHLKCDCSRVIFETIKSDRGNYFNSAFCPDCHWDCVS